ncbi:MAG TPA: hypothetical protein VMY78_05355 [Solirubrobacteraceae bacterium]|nr:hypothetical protein [Solirubrobacteraceae bacterium]
MTHLVILHALDGATEADRILEEFERRTGLEADTRGDDRYYELHDEDHRERIVRTLTSIDASWTDHIGVKIPG